MLKRLLFVFGFVVCMAHQVLAAGRSFTYDSLITMNGATVMESSNAIKEKKLRAEYKGKIDFVLLYNGEKMYMYYPSSNSAMMLPTSHPQAQSSQDALETLDYKKIAGLKLVGEETVEGHACQVYEYEKNGHNAKMWVAKDLQFPVKIETSSENRTIVILNRNVKKDVCLADSLFELPAGAKVADMTNMIEMMKNMKGTRVR